ncbi:hypothetical protein V8E55_004268 [Tylopilus felleus]
MHHALQLDEILSNVFHHFPPVLDKYCHKQPNPSLAALARTCRAFKEPAQSLARCPH